ncbi:hypothetical protein L1887_59516 [Cichorium endivia]|nr:hypothetical protein L1887_59516 [Cichorium endivia]
MGRILGYSPSFCVVVVVQVSARAKPATALYHARRRSRRKAGATGRSTPRARCQGKHVIETPPRFIRVAFNSCLLNTSGCLLCNASTSKGDDTSTERLYTRPSLEHLLTETVRSAASGHAGIGSNLQTPRYQTLESSLAVQSATPSSFRRIVPLADRAKFSSEPPAMWAPGPQPASHKRAFPALSPTTLPRA